MSDSWGGLVGGCFVFAGGCVCGYDQCRYRLPAAEMHAAIDMQDVTSDYRESVK
jgi:hypothetical protein